MKNLAISFLSAVSALSTLTAAAPICPAGPIPGVAPEIFCPDPEPYPGPPSIECLTDPTLDCSMRPPQEQQEPEQQPEPQPEPSPGGKCWSGFGDINCPPEIEYAPACGASGECITITEPALTSALLSARADPGTEVELFPSPNCDGGSIKVDEEGWDDLTNAPPYRSYMMHY